eukprot:scaffold140184_cov20-Prasinocladus_malaysianus.AAC.1
MQHIAPGMNEAVEWVPRQGGNAYLPQCWRPQRRRGDEMLSGERHWTCGGRRRQRVWQIRA